METEIILSKLDKIEQLTLLQSKQALTTSDASLISGLSKSHIYKLINRKSIPYYKSQGGKLIYFSKDELTAWMLKHRVKTVDEVESEAANFLVNKGKRKVADV